MIAFIRTYIGINRKICLNSRRPPDMSVDPSSKNPPFTKTLIVSSDYDAETRPFPQLLRHSDVMAHLIIDHITVMDDPGFENNTLQAP